MDLGAGTLQEVITLSVFVPFAVLYMNQPLRDWGLSVCGDCA